MYMHNFLSNALTQLKFYTYVTTNRLLCFYCHGLYSIPILSFFETHTKKTSASALIYSHARCWLSPLLCHCCPPIPYIIEILKYNKIQFYFIVISILLIHSLHHINFASHHTSFPNYILCTLTSTSSWGCSTIFRNWGSSLHRSRWPLKNMILRDHRLPYVLGQD